MSSPKITPPDEYNGLLLSNVHPPDWINPPPKPCYNLVVIGGGTAGLVTAAAGAHLGAAVALVEKHLMGGDCLNVGCVPSKTLIHSANLVAAVGEAGRCGILHPQKVDVTFAAVMERLRRTRSEISRHDSVSRFRSLGVDVFLGQGRFHSRSSLQVGNDLLHFRKALIATGSRPMVPSIPGLAESGYLTNETVFSLMKRPRSLLVIGAGPVGCELAQAFSRLGSEVTLVDMLPRILPNEDRDAAKILERRLQKENVRLLLGASVRSVETCDGQKKVTLQIGGLEEKLLFQEVLVAVGRIPRLDDLNLARAGVEFDVRKGVLVNDRLQTTNPRIYAAGDVCLSQKFTHSADASARIVVQNALFKGRKRASKLLIPWCTYTDPEIAGVGMTENQAEQSGLKIDTFQVVFNQVDRAFIEGEEEGFVKIHVRQGTDEIAGATIVCRHAGEMINEITVAISARMGLGRLASVIHPYPTRSEAIRKTADLYQRSRLTPRLQKISRAWLSWSR